MSTVNLDFSKLPPAAGVTDADYTVIESKSGAKKIKVTSIVFGLDNVTFKDTISQQSTDINTLSASVNSLSAQTDESVADINALIGTVVQSTTAAFINKVYPVGSILLTTSTESPEVYLLSTSWEQIAQGLFIAGVGGGTDKNGTDFIVAEGNAASNFNVGEYNHTLSIAEMPAHTHTFTPIQGYNALASGQYVESAAGENGKISEMTSSQTGGSQSHNNIPPLFGIYMWKRIT